MSNEFDPFGSNNNNDDFFADSSDPAAEFLAREQAELEKIENGFVDLNVGSNEVNAFSAFETNDFESKDIDPFGIDQPVAVSNPSGSDVYSAISKVDKLTQEPEKIKRWREEQKLRLATKDKEEEQKKEDWREAAKKELDDWYKNRQEQLAKTHANNKAAEAELLANRDETKTGGLEWERVAKLCDFNPKANKNTKDVARLRSILLMLKQQPLVR